MVMASNFPFAVANALGLGFEIVSLPIDQQDRFIGVHAGVSLQRLLRFLWLKFLFFFGIFIVTPYISDVAGEDEILRNAQDKEEPE